MSEVSFSHAQLLDPDLIAEVSRLAASEQQATSRLVAALGEFDARRLYLGQGCSSMFTYCTRMLHLAEHAAYNRIEAARAARRFPVILTLLADGDIHLSAVRLLAPHLTEANHRDVLREASHKSKREVEELVARLRPRPDVVSSVRKLPSAAGLVETTTLTAASHVDGVSEPPAVRAIPLDVLSPPPRGPRIEPLAPERYKVQFTVSREPTSADNLELRCAAHNRYEAEQWFGVFVREQRTSYSPLNTT